jgi:putative hydrolase of the HAD superfamily
VYLFCEEPAINTLSPFLLFDMDDTILNFEAVGNQCWRQLSREYAPRMTGVTADGLYTTIRATSDWYWADPIRHHAGRLDQVRSRREVVSLAFDRLGVHDIELERGMADAYNKQREELVHPFEGAVESLQRLKARGMTLGMITNGSPDYQRRKIERFDLTQFFEVILIEGEQGVSKPDPRIFQRALDLLHAPIDQTTMIGNDLEYDIRPACAMGLQTIWVDLARSGLPAAGTVIPSRIISSITEL